MVSNILVLELVTPEEVAKSVITNILIVIAPPHTLGAMGLAPAILVTNTPAAAQATRVVLVPPAVASIWLVPAPLATNGRTALVKY